MNALPLIEPAYDDAPLLHDRWVVQPFCEIAQTSLPHVPPTAQVPARLPHAGPGASAMVRVERTADRVELDVLDNGSRGTRALVGVSGGNGLIGMRERAHVFGGTLHAGPHPAGGWRVQAVLPFGGT